MEVMKKWIMNARVLLGMLMVQVIGTGLQILSRVILREGAFVFALLMYRLIVAAITIAPFALFWERGVVRKLNFAAFFWLFMVALTGISMAMGLFYYGLKNTTATYATNFLNLIPVVTFFFSTILRIEKLGLGTKAGKMKTLGAIFCLGGALTITLYKGKSFYVTHHHTHKSILKAKQNMTRGTIFLVACCLCYATWFILQVKLFKVFPYKYWATLLICIIGSVQAAIIGLCINRNPKAWRLGWNLQLVTILYSGTLATAATFCMISWAITQKGPTYPSMFNPIALILTLIAEALFLREAISIQSLIGMALIITGLYFFLWGKHKDMKSTPPPPPPPPLEERDSGGGGTSEDARRAMAEHAESQSSAVIVPIASPNND